MAPSEGTKSGSVPDDVGVALGDAVAVVVGVGVDESLAEGDVLALGIGLGVGLVADAAVQPVRTTSIALAAPNRAKRNGMRVQRQTHRTCAAQISTRRPFHAGGGFLLECARGI